MYSCLSKDSKRDKEHDKVINLSITIIKATVYTAQCLDISIRKTEQYESNYMITDKDASRQGEDDKKARLVL